MTREEFVEVMRVALETRLLYTGITLTRIDMEEIITSRYPILVCFFSVRGSDAYALSVSLSDEIFDRQNVYMRDELVDEILYGICDRIDLQTNLNTNRYIGHPSIGNDPWIPESLINRAKVKEEYEEDSFAKLSKKWTQAYAN